MDSAAVVRLESLSRLLQEDCMKRGSDNGRSRKRNNALTDSSGGSALLGTFKVAERTQRLPHHPYHINAGSLLFQDRPGNTKDSKSEPILFRCQVIAPQTSWFGDDVLLLLTHWRYIPPPTPLRGEAAQAWAYLEILSAPVPLPSDIQTPRGLRPLSWWLTHRIHPELAQEQQLASAITECPPLCGPRVAQLLAGKRQLGGSTRAYVKPRSTCAVLGCVRAVSAFSSFADNAEPGFVVDVDVDSASSGPGTGISVPVYLSGSRFSGLFLALCVGDTLFATHLRPTTLSGSTLGQNTMFATTQDSKVYRVDEFDGIEGSQALRSLASRSPSTWNSQSSTQRTSGYKHEPSPQNAPTPRGSVPPSPSVPLVSTPRSSSGAAHQVASVGDSHLTTHGEKLECYTGVITHLVDPMLGLYVVDDAHLLMLTLWPQLSPLLVLRVGTRLLLENMHIVMLSNSNSYHWAWLKHMPASQRDRNPNETLRVLVFGACARSSVRIVTFPESASPPEYPSVLDGSLGALVVRKARGIADILETVEAFWRLGPKLFTTGRNSCADRETAQQQMDMAINLNGSGNSSATGAGRGCRELLREFVDHQVACNVGSVDPRAACRVLTMRDVARRMASRLGEQDKQIGDVGADRSGTLEVTNIYPYELGLEGVPLIGRLKVDRRGCLYLQDATAKLRVYPRAVVGDSEFPESWQDRPVFSGQDLVGHVCAWHSWHLTFEVTHFASEDTGSGIAKDSTKLSVIYAQISGPKLLRMDETFGAPGLEHPCAVMDSRVSGSRAAGNHRASILLFVHSWGLPMPRLAASKRPAASRRPVGTDTKGTQSAWEAVAVARGVGLVLSKEPGDVVDLDVGVVESDQLQTFHVVCRLRETPVHFASGHAYILCIEDMARCRSHRAMASSPSPLTTSVLDIQAADHIHPVRISADVPRSTVGPMDSKAPAGSSELESVARNIPLVKLRPSSSAVWSQIQAPVAYSVHDLFTKADDLTDKIISVRGVIFQREVERIASFTGAARAQEAPDRGGLSVSQVKNRITLQDSDGGSRTVAVYMSLSSYFQPLQLVQGTAVVFRGVTASVAKGSGNPYLTWTAASSVEEVSGEPGPRQCAPAGMDSGAVERPARAYIGQLYKLPGLWNRMVTLLCYVSSVKSLRLKMMCCGCRQAVRSMRCACAKKMHRMVGNEDVRRGGRPATVEADVDLVAVASDGSGLGLLVVSSGPELAALLGLSHDSLDELYCSAAQSLSGQLLWKPQQRSEEPAATSLIDGAAAAIANRAVLVEAVVSQREAPAAKQQALRLDGEDATVARRPEPLMAVARVTCPATTELSWQLLNELGA